MKNIDHSRHESLDPYHSLIGSTVFDRNGARAHLRSLYRKDDATIAVLAMENGHTIDVDLASLERRDDSFFTSLPLVNTGEARENAAQPEWREEMKIPVAEEEIEVEKRNVDTGKGIRVTKHVLEHEEIVNLPYAEETLSVRHVEAGQIVSENDLPQPRQEGDTTIIPVFEEIYVVEKRIRLKEEVHITRVRKESTDTQKVKLRSEKIAIDRFNSGSSSQ